MSLLLLKLAQVLQDVLVYSFQILEFLLRQAFKAFLQKVSHDGRKFPFEFSPWFRKIDFVTSPVIRIRHPLGKPLFL